MFLIAITLQAALDLFFPSRIPSAAELCMFPRISNTWSCTRRVSSFWHVHRSVITKYVGGCQEGTVTRAVARRLSSWLHQDATEGLGTWRLSSLLWESWSCEDRVYSLARQDLTVFTTLCLWVLFGVFDGFFFLNTQ